LQNKQPPLLEFGPSTHLCQPLDGLPYALMGFQEP